MPVKHASVSLTATAMLQQRQQIPAIITVPGVIFFLPLHSKTNHNHQIQFMHQETIQYFIYKNRVLEASHNPNRSLLPCKDTPQLRVEGTPPKVANNLKPFIKCPVETQTEEKLMFPGCATATRSKLWQAQWDRNLPRHYLGFCVLF